MSVLQRSDIDFDPHLDKTRRANRFRPAVRYYNDLENDGQLHDLHQSIRDLTSDQIRIGDDINHEIDLRRR